jgi:hypothetical protein
MSTHPHGPYAVAVMDALGDLHDPAESWTAYDSDDGEVMLMEIIISLDLDKARAAGWSRGLLICWDQTRGWEWAYMTHERGRNSQPEPLVVGPLVTDPAGIVRAVRVLLTEGGDEQLPVEGGERQQPGGVALTPELVKAVGSGEDGDRDVTPEEAAALALYAPQRGASNDGRGD